MTITVRKGVSKLKALLSGNEAIARGAYEAGVRVATAYPGTPSSEILENFASYPGINCSWSPNEKVAMEVAIGASLGGARVMVTMKHVGLNVAADPFVTLSYTGVGGGLVVVCAGDPGMFSSQNEQDNRYYARLAKIPLLEPADSEEARLMVRESLQISEKFDTPVLLLTTTRISHSRTVVNLEDPLSAASLPFKKNPSKYVMLPAYARSRHEMVERRQTALKDLSEKHHFNVWVKGSKKIGIITSGVAFQYAREAFPEAAVLKLGLSYPLPEKKIRAFASQVEELFVVEELEPVLETEIKALGISITGKERLPVVGELRPEVVAHNLAPKKWDGISFQETETLPNRPPLMCPGCGHRGALYTLHRMKLIITGDIGCYTLGALPPLNAMDTCICMGASIGTAFGMEKAQPDSWKKTVAVIGDSTFLHSGVTGLMDIAYNQGKTTVVILDNSTTAMTGHQDHPGTGKTLQKHPSPPLNLEELVKALGIHRVRIENPLQLDSFRQAVQEELDTPEPSVIIASYPCVLHYLIKDQPPIAFQDQCIACRACLAIACPALSLTQKEGASDSVILLDETICSGCGLCVQLCPSGALQRAERKEENGHGKK